MKKSWIVVVAVALFSVGAVTVGAFEDETPKTEDIMKAVFKKGTGKFSSVLKKQVESTPIKWQEIQETTKEIAKLGADLEKNEPEKGSKESFKKLAVKFGENTKHLHEAAESEDLAKVKAAQKTILGSCMECHKSHRGQ